MFISRFSILLAAACFCAVATGRAQTPGSLDATFYLGSGPNGHVTRMTLQPDGKLLISGVFTTFDGVPCRGMARLDADGSLDPTFLLDPTGPTAVAVAMALQPDGKIVVTGSFTDSDNYTECRLERLNADGSLDPTFAVSSRINGTTSAIALQPDGKVIVGGYFTSINYVALENAARFNADGSLDTGFDARLHASVNGLTVQPDGKVIVVGGFSQSNGVTANGIARLNADGSLDKTFHLDTLVICDGTAVELVGDGGIVFGGVNGTAYSTQPQLVLRFNADGSHDPAFDTGAGTPGGVLALAVQPDGKVLIGGGFYRVNGVAAHRIARLNADGSLDVTFDPGSGVDDYVQAMALQPDGKVVIGGEFRTINGEAHPYLARLNGDVPANLVYPAVSGAVNNRHISRGAGQTARLILTRTGDASQALDVGFVPGGHLTAGTDYRALASRLEIPAGQRRAKFKIKPLPGGADGKLTITLQTGANYTLEGNPKFKVRIGD